MSEAASNNSQAKFLDTLKQEAARRQEEILAEARRQADAIIEGARADAEAKRQETLAEIEAELRDIAERERALVKAETDKAAMSVEDQVAEDALAKVRQELKAVAESPRFPGILEGLLHELLQDAPPDVKVIAPEAHAGHVQDWLTENGYTGIEVEGAAWLVDGAALEDPKRSYRITNTLTGRFEKLQNQARRLCMKRLFGGG